MKKQSQWAFCFQLLSFLALLAFPRLIPNAQDPTPDPAAARWVLRSGGSVILDGTNEPIWDLAQLPATPYRLRAVNLVGVLHEPAELERLSKLTHLKELHLSGRTWHNRPAPQVADSL